MSLDITLYNKQDEEVASLNWLRNPFGLCQWAEDNVGEQADAEVWAALCVQYHGYAPAHNVVHLRDEERLLYYVCNHWAYDDAPNVDRALFARVVLAYGKLIGKLVHGYFAFDLTGYRQFVEPNMHLLPKKNSTWGYRSIVGEKYNDDRNKVLIPMNHFTDPAFSLVWDWQARGIVTLTEQYQRWFQELINFATLLQDTELTFYCSN